MVVKLSFTLMKGFTCAESSVFPVIPLYGISICVFMLSGLLSSLVAHLHGRSGVSPGFIKYPQSQISTSLSSIANLFVRQVERG